jgi:hypothetical protein
MIAQLGMKLLKAHPPHSHRWLNISRIHIITVNMKIAVFSTRSYDREFLSEAAAANPTFSASYQFSYYELPFHLLSAWLGLHRNRPKNARRSSALFCPRNTEVSSMGYDLLQLRGKSDSPLGKLEFSFAGP